MNIDVVDEEIRGPMRRAAVGDKPPSRLALRMIRLATRALPAAKVPDVAVEPFRDGRIRLRVYRPPGITSPTPGLLWIHGGGFVLGEAKLDDRHCADTARELGITVVSAEYRLAPEHPFPAALDDAQDAWDWLVAHAASLGVDPARLAIGGQSAGGGLAAACVQRIHDRGGVQPKAQWLFCPMLDDRTAADRELDAANHWVWNNAKNRFGWRAYLGGVEPGGDDVPEFAVPARREDLSDLPPAWLDAGDIELFRDEIVDYAARLRDAGVPAVCDEVPGAPHGFETWAIETAPARAVNARARAWLRDALEGE